MYEGHLGRDNPSWDVRLLGMEGTGCGFAGRLFAFQRPRLLALPGVLPPGLAAPLSIP